MLSVTYMSTPLCVYLPSIFAKLLLLYIISNNITHHIHRTSNKPPIRDDEVQDIDCKSLSNLVYSICPSCLNLNIPMLKLLRMLLMASSFVGQIAYH